MGRPGRDDANHRACRRALPAKPPARGAAENNRRAPPPGASATTGLERRNRCYAMWHHGGKLARPTAPRVASTPRRERPHRSTTEFKGAPRPPRAAKPL